MATSIGGLTAELYARQYPERTAGVAFLDAGNSLTMDARVQMEPWLRPVACTTAIAAYVGVIRLLRPVRPCACR